MLIKLSDGSQYNINKEQLVQLKNEGTYGNGSIDWMKPGNYLYEIMEQLNIENLVAIKVDEKIASREAFISEDCHIDCITADSSAGAEILQRTGAFLLAYSMFMLEENAFTYLNEGIEDEYFYYDFLALPKNHNSLNESGLEKLGSIIAETLKSGKQIKQKKAPYFLVIKELGKRGEHELIKKIDEIDDNGPIDVQVLQNFFSIYTGPLACNLKIIKEVQLVKLVDKEDFYRIYGKTVI